MFFIKASPLRLRQALAAQSRGHRRGADPQSCNAAVLINTSNVEFDWNCLCRAVSGGNFLCTAVNGGAVRGGGVGGEGSGGGGLGIGGR